MNQMTVKERLAELERQHKALEREIAEALGQTSIDDLKITELKRRKLMLKDEIERAAARSCIVMSAVTQERSIKSK